MHPWLLITGFLILWRNRASPDRIAWAFLLAVPPVSILCYLPFYLQLKTHTGAIALVRTPSDPLEFLWVNGIFIAIFFALLVPEIRKKPWLLLACLPFALAGYVAAAIAVIPLVYFIAKADRDLPDILAAFGLAILVVMRTHLHEGQHGGDIFPDEHGLQVLSSRMADARYCCVCHGGAMVHYLSTGYPPFPAGYLLC